MNPHLKARLAWYSSHQDAVPERLHRMRVFDAAGRPQWTPEFMRYIFEGVDSLERSYDRVPCPHSNQANPDKCTSCGITGSTGEVLASSGFIRREQLRYRRPMRRALAQLAGGENGQVLTTIIAVWQHEGEPGLRELSTEMKIEWRSIEELMLKALIRLERYYRVEPEYGGHVRARSRRIRDNSRRPSRPATPDRS